MRTSGDTGWIAMNRFREEEVNGLIFSSKIASETTNII